MLMTTYEDGNPISKGRYQLIEERMDALQPSTYNHRCVSR